MCAHSCIEKQGARVREVLTVLARDHGLSLEVYTMLAMVQAFHGTARHGGYAK